MQITLSDNKVFNLKFKDFKFKHRQAENNFRLMYEAVFSDDTKNDFFITFNFEYNNVVTNQKLELQYVSYFQTRDGLIDDKFKESAFATVNAPAIAYPFLRAFVMNFFVSSGYSAIVLPSINFTKYKPGDLIDSLPPHNIKKSIK